MKKQPVKKEPSPGSPLARAKQLDKIAAQPAPDTAGLPEKERLYVEKLHGYLVRYWHREISGEELAAHRNMLAAHLLCESQKSYYTRLWGKRRYIPCQRNETAAGRRMSSGSMKQR